MKQIEKPEVGKRYFMEVEYLRFSDDPPNIVPHYCQITGDNTRWFGRETIFYTNEPEAMKQDKEFAPEWGKEYEFKNGDQAWRKAKFIAMDVNKPNEYLAQPDSGYIISFEHIRPITKTIREEIAFELGRPDNHYKVDKLLEIFSRHNQLVMPSDDVVLEYHANNGGNILATVKHFLTRKP